MFTNLMNFGYQRTTKQALGFYLAYFIVVILLGALSRGLAGIIAGDHSFDMGVKVGTFTASILCIVLVPCNNYNFG